MIAVALAGAVTCVAAFAALGRCCWSWNWRRECCGLAGAVAAALIFGLAIPPFDLGQAWNLSGMSQQYGYLLSFSTCAKASLSHGKPQGYSRQQVDGILGSPRPRNWPATGQASPISSSS